MIVVVVVMAITMRMIIRMTTMTRLAISSDNNDKLVMVMEVLG